MPGKNIHKEPFDEGTITKLEIFQRYCREWLPVFVMAKSKRVNIFDFFAGTGYDVKGVPGSPIRILEEIKGQIDNIRKNGTIIHIYLNEYVKKKQEKLIEAVKQYLDKHPELKLPQNIRIHPYSEDFGVLYEKLEPLIGEVPSLVYLDQNGIKFIADKYLNSLVRKTQTDFFYYLSSSFFVRFGDTPEFKAIVPEATMEEIREKPYRYIHNEILNYLKSKLPEGSPVRMFPFTIKKKAGVYGIIFGASHILAADKFLRVAWKINEVNGAANFDIDDDSQKDQLELFDPQPIKKIDAFKQELHRRIMAREIRNNREAFDFATDRGHIGTHAKEEIAEMKRKKIDNLRRHSTQGKLPGCLSKERNRGIQDSNEEMSTTKIEWTDATWNPVTGCTKTSAGCLHCYAETMSRRLKAMGTEKYRNGFQVTLHEETLDEPRKWRKPRTIFVCSMSDLFHKDVPFEFVDKVMKVVKDTPQHRYQLLTKRAERMEEYFRTREVPGNVWIGVTVEVKSSKARIENLRAIKDAPIRFLSCEPLLEDLGMLDLTGIDWIIVGGESGLQARPMKEEWVKNIKAQCEEAGKAFFFKQWGTWGSDGVKRDKHKNGKHLDGKICQAMPEETRANEK